MRETSRQDILKRFSALEGQIAHVRALLQEDQYCADILRQTHALRKMLEELEQIIMIGHLQTCVAHGIKAGQDQHVIRELLDIYAIVANR